MPNISELSAKMLDGYLVFFSTIALFQRACRQWRRQLDKCGDILIYSCFANLISFEVDLISKEN